jgi:hypothetical protein
MDVPLALAVDSVLQDESSDDGFRFKRELAPIARVELFSSHGCRLGSWLYLKGKRHFGSTSKVRTTFNLFDCCMF